MVVSTDAKFLLVSQRKWFIFDSGLDSLKPVVAEISVSIFMNGNHIVNFETVCVGDRNSNVNLLAVARRGFVFEYPLDSLL